jgi:hypothetical protein
LFILDDARHSQIFPTKLFWVLEVFMKNETDRLIADPITDTNADKRI